MRNQKNYFRITTNKTSDGKYQVDYFLIDSLIKKLNSRQCYDFKNKKQLFNTYKRMFPKVEMIDTIPSFVQEVDNHLILETKTNEHGLPSYIKTAC